MNLIINCLFYEYAWFFSLADVDWQYQIWKWGVIFTDNVSGFHVYEYDLFDEKSRYMFK